eukprot:TRINITY_DN8368_c2_g1_i1.p1 TRINITY_DN8368_c2_g1~~TRINITY_DN8368_c2_g1_i1.p1  ORF type:complete len:313 (+),score=42.18 TRINITY_DN8368_c2_g1_i1:77-1015(+)
MISSVLGIIGVLFGGLVLPLFALLADVTMFPGHLPSRVVVSDTCCAGNGMSVLIAASLNVTMVALILRRLLLPRYFPNWQNLGGSQEKLFIRQRKIVVMCIAFMLRGVCLIGMFQVLPSFSYEKGLTFKATSAGSPCDITAPDVPAVRSFYLARCWISALMIWELAYIPGLQWDDYVHHIFVLAAVVTTTDPSFGGDKFTGDSQAAGMVVLFGACLASFNYLFLLCYNIFQSHPSRQAICMFIAAIYSWSWQLLCFVYYPLSIIYNSYVANRCSVVVLILWLVGGGSLFIIDSKANITRLEISMAKWKVKTD